MCQITIESSEGASGAAVASHPRSFTFMYVQQSKQQVPQGDEESGNLLFAQ